MREQTNYLTQESKSPTTDRWIDLGEANTITGLAPVTLRNAERRGDLTGYRVLGRLRFKLSDVYAFMENGREAPRRTPPPEFLEAATRRKGNGRKRR